MNDILTTNNLNKKEFKKKSIISEPNFINVIDVAVSLVTRKRREIKISYDGDSSYTDGRSINIGVMDFLFSKSDTELKHCIIALALHEAEHVVNTSFTLSEEYRNIIKNTYNDYVCSIALNILNCIEDGRIERIDKIKYPVNSKYINLLRTIWHEEQPLSIMPISTDNQNNKISKSYKIINDAIFAVCSLATTGKLPMNWHELYDETVSNDFIEEVRPLITKGVLADNFPDCLEVSDKIFKIFIKVFEKDISLCENFYSSVVKLYGDILSGCEGEDTNGFTFDNNLSKELYDVLEKFNNENVRGVGKEVMPVTVSNIANISHSSFNHDILKLKKEVKKILDFKQSKDKFNLKSGKINNSKLWKVSLSDDKVFKKTKVKKDKNTAIYFLIDCSGSMCGSKIETANKLGAIVEEAFSEFINLEIAYFSDTHNIVRKFDSDDKKYYVWSYQAKAQGCNCDYENIRKAREILEKRKEKNKVILIISDGMPCPNGNEPNAEQAVKKEVSKAKIKNINTIAIALENNNRAYRDMYKHIIYTNINNINSKLCSVLKKVIS